MQIEIIATKIKDNASRESPNAPTISKHTKKKPREPGRECNLYINLVMVQRITAPSIWSHKRGPSSSSESDVGSLQKQGIIVKHL